MTGHDGNGGRWLGVLAPLIFGLVVLGLWQWGVRAYDVPTYVAPGPWLVLKTLWTDGPSLLGSLWVTLRIALTALATAVVIAVALAVVMSQSRWVEASLLPYAIVLQVTPIVAIAPLIIIWVKDVFLSLLVCAWIVCFFPILSNTTLGLNSADRGLVDLFRLYRATRLQSFLYLRAPTALPYFLAGLRISGGLALIGAVVAEFVAGTGGTETGLAYRILEAGYRLQIPRMFAALVLLSLAGIAIYFILDRLSFRLLRNWHESALPREK